MIEPTGHCPYLGLKQNRAIRFDSPTPEHRCYVSGEPLEIPVDQSSYCLAQGHVHCPLYMGLTISTTDPMPAIVGGTVAAPPAGLRGWYGTLSPRDRAVYAIMLALLAFIVAIYLFVGLQTLLGGGGGTSIGSAPTSQPMPAQATAPASPSAPAVTATPTAIPPTPTRLPTAIPTPRPTAEPTQAPLIFPPTSRPTAPPTATRAPTSAPAVVPTSAPRPTSAPVQPSPPVPTAAPPAAMTVQPVTLYFGDVTGTLLVPARRNARVENNRVAAAAIAELIAGPRGGLSRLVPADVKLLGLTINGGTATVNFDRDPGSQSGYDSLIFTLTEFPSIARVQFQINGRNVGGVRGRAVLNPINPDGLPDDKGATEYLPLYFPSVDGVHDVRLIRMVPKTRQTAEGTVRALLEGPGPYAGAVIEVIPAGTELRGIKIEHGVVLVDFTAPFIGAPDAAIRTITQALTTLKSVRGVQFLVEGQVYLDGQIFGRTTINQE